MYASGIGATQACPQVMRVGDAIEDQKERLIERSNQIRQIVFLILTPRLHASNNPLMYRTLAFLIQKLTVSQLNDNTLCFQCVDQRQQAFIFTTFENKDVLEALRRTFQQSLHRMDAVNHFTHECTR